MSSVLSESEMARSSPVDLPLVDDADGTESYSIAEGLSLSAIVLVGSLYVAYQLVFRYHILYGDAMSRVLNGMYVTLRPGFHLAAVGFLWNPLPALLSIPLALLRFAWPPMMEYGFAANILSACFGAVGVFYLNRLFWRFGISRPIRIVLCLLYITNPMILLYDGNGMTDGMMTAITIACTENVSAYLKTKRPFALVEAGVWLALGFMTRYESVPIGGMIGLGLGVAMLKTRRSWPKAESAMVTFWFPVVCAGLSWILLNWMIMKNPLYFADSRYGNSVQISSGLYNTAAVVAARHHIMTTLYEVFRFSSLFWPYAPLAVATLFLSLRRRNDGVGLPILMGSLGAPILQILLLYTHRSADWVRFFIYYIPFGVMLAGYLISQFGKRGRTLAGVATILLLLSVSYETLNTLQNPVWGNGDNWAVDNILGNGKTAQSAENNYDAVMAAKYVADYINAHPHLTVIVSSFTSFAVIPFIQHPQQVVITSDSDFKSILDNPRGRVQAILASPVNAFTTASDLITATYPTLWSGQVPWTKLIVQFPNGSRLYGVLPDAP